MTPGAAGGVGGVAQQVVQQVRPAADLEKVKKVFDDADGIGGGCGLKKLRPFFGANGLYKGDDKNPFKDRLPSNDEIERTVENGKAKDVRELVVNAARSKNNCKEVGGLLESVFKKIRSKIGHFKDDLETAKKGTKSLEEQIDFLGAELKEVEGRELNIKTFLAQLQDLKQQSVKIVEDRKKLQDTLKTANDQIELYQAEIARNTQKIKALKEKDGERVGRIAKIDDEIDKLQARIKELNDKKDIINKESDSNRELLLKTNQDNDSLNAKITAIRITV